MSAKPLELKKVKVEEAKKSSAEKEQELIAQKVLSDRLNSDKAKRDVQIRTVDELEVRIKNLTSEIERLTIDYNMKMRINENLGSSIQGAHIDLANIQRKFEDQNAKLVTSYEKKVREVEDADSQLQILIKENRDKAQALARERSLFDQERESNRQLVKSIEASLTQNNAQWKVREADILARENALKIEKDEFDVYRSSLAPEIDRITSIKNENILLIQRLEQEMRNVENIRLAAQAERNQAEESKAQMVDRSNQDRMRIAGEEARLRKWEQDLKDNALELRAKESEYNRVLRRDRLQKEVDNYETDNVSKENK